MRPLQLRVACEGIVETLGRMGMGGQLDHAFTAHPKAREGGWAMEGPREQRRGRRRLCRALTWGAASLAARLAPCCLLRQRGELPSRPGARPRDLRETSQHKASHGMDIQRRAPLPSP